MPDDGKEKRGEEDGRVVYSRAAGEGAPRETVGAGLARIGREQVAPALPVLVVSFLVLVGLVYALGRLSVGQLDEVSNETQRLQQQQSGRVQFLLGLRTSLTNLDFEARDRGTRERQGGIINPFDHKLTVARDDARRQLKSFEGRADARTPQGAALLAEAAEFLRSTEDPESYSIGGFERFRKLERSVQGITNEANGRQDEIGAERVRLFNAARDRINRLRNFAVLLAALVAAATAWEVQRRFRQVRRSLEESRREREFSSQMLEGMVTAVAAVDGRDRVRSANRAFFRLFPRATVGASVYEEIAPPDAMRMFAAAAGSRVEESTYRGRWTLTPEGVEDARQFEVYSSPLHLDDGHGQILTLFDVTDAARNESELRRKTALAAVGQAAAQVAHEIKNPLGSIRLGVAMLRDMTAGEEAHSTIDLVERGIEHLNKLTIDVTQYSHEKPLALAPADLHRLLDTSLELVSDNLREKRTPVERDYAGAPLAGELDADQLRQVFVNIIANAVDASPEGSPVRVSTARTESRKIAGGGGAAGANGGGGAAGPPVPHARVTIEDRGAGMDARTSAHVFEPFFTTKKRGTGLGLAIVKKIVEQHGGTITFESEVGSGTRFHVELPLRGASAEES